MDYLADTVAIVRHLRTHPALGSEAVRMLREADEGVHRVFLSAISLMEVLYLSEAKRIDVPLAELVAMVSSGPNHEIVPENPDVVLAAAEIDDVPELHGRVIVATARYLGVPILAADQVIAASRRRQTLL